MAFEDLDIEAEEVEIENGVPYTGSNNRNFMIIAAVLGAITLLVLICLAAFVLLNGRGNGGRITAADQAATSDAQQTAVAMAVTETSRAILAAQPEPTETATPSPIPDTPTPTNTQVVAVPTNTSTSPPTMDSRTATISFLLTQAAIATQTVVVSVTPAATSLPEGGFADSIGLPGMFGLAVGLMVVIVLARRLRTV